MFVNLKSIIFDLDGTLIDSAPSILFGFDHVLKANSLEPLIPITSSIIGPPLVQTLRMLSGINDEKKLLKMAEQFKEYYDFNACLLCQPYHDVDEGLRKLVQANFELHIATNKRYVPTRYILKHLAWDNFFTSVYTLDKNELPFKSKSQMLKKQLEDLDLSVDQAIYVGDRTEDMDAANNNQLNFVGVSWGYGDFPNHIKAIQSFSQLNNLVAK
jgi:phosphoglycolate phosphatase